MRIFILALIILSLYGCSEVKEAQSTRDVPKCKSVVEIFYTTDTTYKANPPHLLLKTKEYSNDTRYLYGSIISINDSGVVFQRSKTPKLYTYDNIECLIDANNRIVYGKWKNDPEVVWQTELICKKIGVPNSEPFSLILKANQISSYCLEPGEYEISSIRFSCSDEVLDESDTLKFGGFTDNLKFGRFTVAKNATNYLGSIYSEFKRDLSPGMTLIPTTIIRRMGMGGAAAGGAAFGMVGGIVGALNDQAQLERERSRAPLHGLKVTMDPNYKPFFKGNLPVVQSPIIFEKSAFTNR